MLYNYFFIFAISQAFEGVLLIVGFYWASYKIINSY